MPIVFVHGVDTRDGEEYRKVEAGRNAFLRTHVAPALGILATDVKIFNPYWGKFGAEFAWNLAVLPDPSDHFQAFGSEDSCVNLLPVDSTAVNSLHDLAIVDFPAAVELLFEAALLAVTTETEANAVAQAYEPCLAYAKANPAPTWMLGVSDMNLLGHLVTEAVPSYEEKFGIAQALDGLSEGLSRLNQILPRVGTAIATDFWRKNLNVKLTRFCGDAFGYLATRGDVSVPGPIVKEVHIALSAAVAARSPNDNKLIVIGHSFGGQICYDILSHFDATHTVDYLVTVGSQVGLFEEMKLFVASDKGLPSQTKKKVSKLPNLGNWLNVFDLNDVLSYRAEPVFEGCEDFVYNTGYGIGQAHSGYFTRPDFYRHLAARIASGK